MQPPFPAVRQAPGRRSNEAGITLLEVLAAIFIMAVGLLAVLTLFPLGAIEMAKAIRSDRTAAIAAQAEALSEAGQALVSRTLVFVQISISKGSADPDEAAKLGDRYEQLAQESVEIEIALANLQYELPNAPIRRYTDPLLAQIRSIEKRIAQMIQLLAMVEGFVTEGGTSG